MNERFAVSISTGPVSDEKGKPISAMSVIEDIRDRKRIEQELREKSDVLATVTQALNTFLDKGDWSAASQQLLTFAIRQTESEYGLLGVVRSEEHTSELQSRPHLVCRLLLDTK